MLLLQSFNFSKAILLFTGQARLDLFLLSDTFKTSFLDVSKNLLAALFLVLETLVKVLLVTSVTLALVFQQALQAKVLFCKLHSFQAGFLSNQLLFIRHALDLKISLLIKQLIPSFNVGILALVIIVKENTSFMILVVDLLEVAVLSTS